MDGTILLRDITLMAFSLIVITLSVKPLGEYMTAVYEGKRTFLSRFLKPLEETIYRAIGVSDKTEMTWKQYTAALLWFNGFGVVVLFAILLSQGYLPLNPQGIPGMPWDLALNTAVSFVTNTNWQNYAGETAASYLAQMLGLTLQNFLSAATGLCIALVLVRGFARHNTHMVGNFWADMTRSVLYILLPLSLVLSIVLVSQGVIQNLNPYVHASLVQAPQGATGQVVEQVLPMGPVASQEAIKEIGANGGGYFSANSAHPFENPTPLSNLLEILSILAIPAALTYVFGKMGGNTRQGWALYAVMLILFTMALGGLYWAEANGVPRLQKLGVSGPYLEGKEMRFGLGGSTLFVASTTAVSAGAVNSMHDSLTPLGGMVPMLLIALGEVVFGGVGSGLYSMLAFAIIAVFVAGLMIGRIPEYLGKKVGPREMWMSVVIVLTSTAVALLFASAALTIPPGTSAILNTGPHGLSEVLYAALSMANNNGSAFAGLNGNTLFWNLAGVITMLLGRFVPAVAAMAMAGALSRKVHTPLSAGTLRTDRISFVVWLAFIIIIIGALSFFPAFAAGPIVEHLLMPGG